MLSHIPLRKCKTNNTNISAGQLKQQGELDRLIRIIKLTVMTMMINITKIFVARLQKGTKVQKIQSVWFNKETEQLIGH